VERGDATSLSAATVRAALPRLVGEISQVPPMYSAVRVGGRRLYEAARAGEQVERAPRVVRVDELELLSFEPAPSSDAPARAQLRVRCGKGTYVRTLAADLGRAVGVPAHLARLRRTRAGPFMLADALPLEALEALAASDPARVAARLVPVEEALRFMPSLRLSEEQACAVSHGRALPVQQVEPVVLALAPDGGLLALLAPVPGGARPFRVFPRPGTR
jgi:tRNA pseudouridine55 synthase